MGGEDQIPAAPEAGGAAGMKVSPGAEPPAAGAPGVGVDGSSGHSHLRQLRFAFGGYGPFAASLVILFAKDMYILKLGASAERMGYIAAAWSALFPFMYPVAGHLMDREPPVLDWPGWGRRAPWYLTHLVPLSVAVAVIYLPGLAWLPAAGSYVLDAWLAVCLFVSAWCLAVLLNAFESARAEIYPFREERVLVEAMTKFIGAFAAATGIVPQFILWIVATMEARAAVSVFLLVCVLLSSEVVPVLKDARQPRSSHARVSLREIMEVLRSPAMAHATAVRFWHAAADTTAVNFGIYYVTFVDGCGSAERTKYMLVAGVCVGLMELGLLTPLWGYIWTRPPAATGPGALSQRSAPSMRAVCTTLHVLGAVLPPLMLRLLPVIFPGLARPWEWILATIVLRFCYSPQTFFRTNSFCWAVDDDCHRGMGRRREAVHAGVVKFFEDEGRALAFALFLGVGWAGLQTENCELHCEGAGDREACVKACDRLDIERQPEIVSEYILAILTYVVPLFGLLCAMHIWLFPLHGERLRRLQEVQAVLFKDVRSVPSNQAGDRLEGPPAEAAPKLEASAAPRPSGPPRSPVAPAPPTDCWILAPPATPGGSRAAD